MFCAAIIAVDIMAVVPVRIALNRFPISKVVSLRDLVRIPIVSDLNMAWQK